MRHESAWIVFLPSSGLTLSQLGPDSVDSREKTNASVGRPASCFQLGNDVGDDGQNLGGLLNARKQVNEDLQLLVCQQLEVLRMNSAPSLASLMTEGPDGFPENGGRDSWQLSRRLWIPWASGEGLALGIPEVRQYVGLAF